MINPGQKPPRAPGIGLDEQRKADIVRALIGFYAAEFDETLSDYRAEMLVDFLLHQIGPSQYNQAIQDARKYMLQKLDDLDAEFYQPEER